MFAIRALPLFVLLACQAQANQQAPAVAASAPAATAGQSGPVATYGAALTPADKMTVADVLARAAELGDRNVTVEGHVRRACAKKGCWMELAASAEPAAPGMRVTFKGYGFFVPTDSAGSKARIQGNINIRVVPKADVDHLEAEGATFSEKAPDGSAKEIQFVATGVELWRS